MNLNKLHDQVINKIRETSEQIDKLWVQTGAYYSNTYELIDPKYQKQNDDLCDYVNRLWAFEAKLENLIRHKFDMKVKGSL